MSVGGCQPDFNGSHLTLALQARNAEIAAVRSFRFPLRRLQEVRLRRSWFARGTGAGSVSRTRHSSPRSRRCQQDKHYTSRRRQTTCLPGRAPHLNSANIGQSVLQYFLSRVYPWLDLKVFGQKERQGPTRRLCRGNTVRSRPPDLQLWLLASNAPVAWTRLRRSVPVSARHKCRMRRERLCRFESK